MTMRAVWMFSLLTMPLGRVIEVFQVNWRTLTVLLPVIDRHREAAEHRVAGAAREQLEAEQAAVV